MKLLFTLVFLLGFWYTAFAQTDAISKIDLDGLYIRTIRKQGTLYLSSGPKYFEITENLNRIKDHDALKYFNILTEDDLIKTALKKRMPLIFYRVGHNRIAKDTIDINIKLVELVAKRSIHFDKGLRTKKASFSDFCISCGDVTEYKPTARFVYDPKTEAWIEIEYITP